jgi:7-keto-8-aminopelargonate synthetase-like enzyme
MRNKFYNEVFSIIQKSKESGIAHLTTDDKGFKRNSVSIDGREYVNFTLCDYLAFSHDERIKEGAIKALEKHGFYASISRTYIKLDLYEEAEEYLSKVFEKPAIIFPRASLAHIGVLPVITDTNDAILIDHQVHTSIRLASDLLKSYGNYVEVIRHNRIDILEDKIKELSKKYSKVWYLTDGVFSMYGDVLPTHDLQSLLNKYEQFYLYIDDAHGLSWDGKNGKGFTLENLPLHSKMVVSASLCKGIGAEGGVTVCYDEDVKKKLVTCAAPLIFTSPISPASLGAIIESCKIHLSEEIYEKQAGLKERIILFKKTASEINIPLVDSSDTPIFFIASGMIDMSNELCKRLMDRGFYTNVSHYPAVPMNCSGIRVLISLYQSKEDLVQLLNAIKEEYDKILIKRNININEVLKHYKIQKQETEIL